MGKESNRRQALAALLLLVPAPSLGTLAAMVWFPGPAGQAIYAACKIWLLLFPLFWHLRIDRGVLSWSPPTRGGFRAGLLIGVSIGLLILLGYLLFGKAFVNADHVRAMAIQNGIGTPLRYLGFSAYLVLVNSLLEEYVWRWFIFRKCEVLLASGSAVVASAACFTLHHVFALAAQSGWRLTTLGSLGVFMGGVIWSWCYLRYRSIWPGYLSHVLLDITILAIGWRLIFV